MNDFEMRMTLAEMKWSTKDLHDVAETLNNLTDLVNFHYLNGDNQQAVNLLNKIRPYYDKCRCALSLAKGMCAEIKDTNFTNIQVKVKKDKES